MLPREPLDPTVRTADNPLLVKANMAAPTMYKTTAAASSSQSSKEFRDILDNLTKNWQTVYTTINGQPVAVTPIPEAPPPKEESFFDSSTLLILGVAAAGAVAVWFMMR
jgi:hypothetical protein